MNQMTKPESARRGGTLRKRVLLLVAGAGVLPLALLAFWLTADTARMGERLLRSRLQTALNDSEQHIALRWAEERYAILLFAESDDIQRELQQSPRPSWQPADLLRLLQRLSGSVQAISIIDGSGRVRWQHARSDAESEPMIDVDLPIFEKQDGAALGVVRARLRLQALLPNREHTAAGIGAVLAIIDRASGRSLLPLPFGDVSLETRGFSWGEDEWLAEQRSMREPPLTLVTAAPITLFRKPFTQTAVRAALGLSIIALTGLVVAAFVAKRLTRALEELADAATAVAQGDLEHNVEVSGTAEVRNVAEAFNSMTGNLRRSLETAAQREALAAVGSFAAEIAHEVRNPLGAMRLDLELIEEQLPTDSPLRARQHEVINEVDRLNDVVGGALDLARSGRVTHARMNVADPLRTAVHLAAPHFEQRAGCLSLAVPEQDVVICGDQHSLQRLFLNLLLNAADAVPDRGHCDVALDILEQNARVRISDNGRGMDAETLARATDSFFTTKAEGTGLGLAIATRIAHAHGGHLSIAAAVGNGTIVELLLPLA